MVDLVTNVHKFINFFSGLAFVKWISHTLLSDAYLKVQLTDQDMKFIGKQIGSLLLTAEVIKDLEGSQNSEISFKVCLFIYLYINETLGHKFHPYSILTS